MTGGFYPGHGPNRQFTPIRRSEALVALVTWQAIFATPEVARSFWRMYVSGLKRNKDCTIAEAWLYAFWHGGLMR